MKKHQTLLSLSLLPLLLISCSNSLQVTDDPTLQATLWVQNAAEYDALTRQAYQTAEFWLEAALDDSTWTAYPQQAGEELSQFPPAVVLDIDETILDNSPFQARMIKQNKGFNIEDWTAWVVEANAPAVPGALEFTKHAAELGIRVIYLSNRDAATESATRANLESLGFPLSEAGDPVLLQNERNHWTSAKIERRSHVARQFRILMLIGDDLNDFLYAKEMSETERDRLVSTNADKWGRKWFAMPNPVYGSWEDTLFGFEDDLSEKEKVEILTRQLRTRESLP